MAIAREVYRWREERALELNRPSRFILRDDLIVEIAKKNPTTEKDFSSLRGLGKIDFSGILRAVERARSMPSNQWPEESERDNDPPQVGMIAQLLGTILSDLCIKRHLSSAFVTTASDLRTLVRCRLNQEPLGSDFPLNRGWRSETILPTLQGFLEGKRSIRIGNVHSEAPFEFEEVNSNSAK